jgi:hypothetical protein
MFHMPYGKSHYDGSILKAEFIAVLTSSLLLNDPTPCIQLPSSVHIHFNFNLNLNRQSKCLSKCIPVPAAVYVLWPYLKTRSFLCHTLQPWYPSPFNSPSTPFQIKIALPMK